MLKDTRKCVCGTLMESTRLDCGTPECVTRTLILDSERAERTERFKELPSLMAYNREREVERAGLMQRATQTSMHQIMRQTQHEALLRMYAELRSLEQNEA